MKALSQWLGAGWATTKERFRRPDVAEDPEPESQSAGPKLILELLGAAAGVAALMALAGGALLWLRFDRLGLPADRAVALLPREMLVTVGAHALLAATVAGVVAVVAIYALGNHSEVVLGILAAAISWIALLAIWDKLAPISLEGLVLPLILTGALSVEVGLGAYLISLANGRDLLKKGIGSDNRPMVVTLGVVGVGLVGLLSQLDSVRILPWAGIVVGAALLGGVIIYTSTKQALRRRKTVLWTVFVTYLAVGTTVALVRTGSEPKMEPIAVLLEDPVQQIAGFYVGESDGEIHIAQLAIGSAGGALSAERVDAVVSVSRERVTRKALRAPAGLDSTGKGPGQAERLLRNLIAERDAAGDTKPTTAPVPTRAPEKSFAPLLSLHSAEPIGPTSADEFLRNARLFWAFRDCGSRRKLISDPLTSRARWRDLGDGGFRQRAGCGNDGEYSTSDFTRPHDKKRTFEERAALTGREGFYLDLTDSLRTPELKSTVENGQHVLEPVPVYFERHEEVGDDGLTNERITYWFFYPYSSPTGEAGRALRIGHEGDWERISVLARQTGDGLWLPLSVRFHEHNTSVDVPWERVDKVADESGVVTHPRAYVAKGSHATYSRPDDHPQILRRSNREILAVTDETNVCPDCPLWHTWRSSQRSGKAVEMLVDATKEPWYGFGGAWGVVGSASDFTGPLGPSIRKTRQGRSPSPETALLPAPAAKIDPLPAASSRP